MIILFECLLKISNYALGKDFLFILNLLAINGYLDKKS